jgi:hypothetical protein
MPVPSLEDHVALLSQPWERAAVLELLLSYGGLPHEREVDRVCWVILERSNHSIERVRSMVATAKKDYRDVLIGDPGYDP